MQTITRLISRNFVYCGLATSATFVIISSISSKAMALTSFTGDYAPNNWTLTKANPLTNQSSISLQKYDGSLVSLDGDVDTANATASGSIDLYGSNTNSGNPSNVDWTISITSPASISFDWSYFSQALAGQTTAGYLLNGNFNTLATEDGQGSTSSTTILVSAGNTFGFRVATIDNTSGQGVLTVNNFDAQPVPFEFSPTLSLLVLGGCFGGKKLINKFKNYRSRS